MPNGDGQQQSQPRPFNDIAKEFDPLMPQETYDNIRQQYFKQVVQPKVGPQDSIQATWEAFKKQTERQPILSVKDKITATLGVGATSAEKELMAPMEGMDTSGQVKRTMDHLTKQGDVMTKLLEREGVHSAPAAKVIGGMIGGTAPMIAAWEGAGPVAEQIAAKALTNAKQIEVAARVARGSLSFATYNAAAETDGDRLVAGLKGAALGAGMEGLLSIPAVLRGKTELSGEAANDIARDAMLGRPVPPEADKVIANRIQNDVKVAKQEGRPNGAFEMTPSTPGVRAVMADDKGRGIIIPIKSGQEHVALQRFKQILDKGGSFEHFEAHPNDVDLMNRFGGMLQEGQEKKLDTLSVRTPDGDAEAVAGNARQEGIPAEAQGSDHVELHVQKHPSDLVQPKAQSTADAIATLNKPTEDTVEAALDKFRNAAGAQLDEKGKNFFRRQIEVAWDHTMPEGAKTGALAVVHKSFPDLMPPSFNKDVTKTILERTAETTEKMSDEHLDEVLQGYGIDPQHPDVDREYFKTLGETQLDEMLGKKGIQPQEFFKPEEGFELIHPASEELELRGDESDIRAKINSNDKFRFLFDNAGEDPQGIEVKDRPSGMRATISPELMDRIMPGAGGVTWNVQGVFDKLGIDIPKEMRGSEPLVLLTQDTDKATIYHESLHNLARKTATSDFMENIPSKYKGTALGIAEGLGNEFDVYGAQGFASRAEEAYVHSAEAIRFNDKAKLDQLADWDTSLEHVKEFVHTTSNQILDTLDNSIDSVQKRAFQRKLTDLVRRTDNNMQSAFRRNIGAAREVWYNKEKDLYELLSSDGESTYSFKDPADVFDYLYSSDLNQLASSASYSAELRGVRGSMVPHGLEPNGRKPMPENPPDPSRGEGFGLTPVSGWFRPMGSWVNTVHEKLNSMFASKGQYLPLAERWKDVDLAVRDGDNWLQGWYKKVGENLQGTSSEKQYDMFQYLVDSKRVGKESKYGLTLEEAKIADAHYDLLKEFQDDTHIQVLDYLHNRYPLLRGGLGNDAVFGPLKKPSQMGFWEKAIREDQSFDPQDAHLGRFSQFLIREGFEKKFTGEPLSKLAELVNLQSKDGRYVLGGVKWPLENYIKYVKGIPDNSQQAINKVLGSFSENLSKRMSQLNQHLPEFAQLPTGKIVPKDLMNKFMVFSYAAGLGLRPAIFLRDSMQAFTIAMPLFGPTRFAKGLAEALTPTGYKAAEAAGALLGKTNVGELMGDITNEIPAGGKGLFDRLARWSNAILQPSRYGHNVSRAIAYHAEYGDALRAVQAFRSGDMGLDELMKDPVLWFADKPDQARLLGLISDHGVEAEDAAKEMALHATELTMWPYRRGAQPSALRTGLGRIFGQYGMWPANYMDFLRRLGTKYAEHPAEALRMTATWAAVNYTAVSALNGLGADVGHWFWQSPAGYGGSPHLDFVQNLMKAPMETKEGKDARKAVLEYPLNFIPASNEIHAILTSMQDGGDSQADILRLIGVKPLKESPDNDEDFQQWINQELGFPKGQP
jgi:hypothetical protein